MLEFTLKLHHNISRVKKVDENQEDVKCWTKKKLTNDLFENFSATHQSRKKSVAHFSTALFVFMQITKIALISFLDNSYPKIFHKY